MTKCITCNRKLERYCDCKQLHICDICFQYLHINNEDLGEIQE